MSAGFEPSHSLAEARDLTPGTGGLRLAGALAERRTLGKLSLAQLLDGGVGLQLAVSRDDLPDPETYRVFTRLPLGTRIGVEGALTRTQAGTLTLDVSRWTPLDGDPPKPEGPSPSPARLR